ncbi:MAG: hypothetical protein CMJ78_14645 [Planctomycetaceae bacterium]|nr:hypothetical protein [Planctomycetaceae bacterium]
MVASVSVYLQRTTLASLIGLFSMCLLHADDAQPRSAAFLKNRPKTFRGENRIVWQDVEHQPDDDVFYQTRKLSFRGKNRTNEFACRVNGDLEPLNRFVRLKASGRVINPKVTTDSSIDASSPASVARGLIKPNMSDREKALAIWYFLADQFYWRSNPRDFVPRQTTNRCDPVVLLNCYGYSECSFLGPLEAAYWRAAGLKARKVRNGPKGKIFHSLGEVYYDGDWHLFDLTEMAFYLERDDKTIASGQDICDDPGLALRMVGRDGLNPSHQRGDYVASKFGQMFGGGTTALPGDRYLGYTFPPAQTMGGTLAAGQTFQRNWSNEGFFWNAWEGQKEYSIEEEKHARLERFPEFFGNGATTLALGARQRSFTVSVNSPYPILDLALAGTFYRQSNNDEVKIDYSVDSGQNFLPLTEITKTGQQIRVETEQPILRGMYKLLVRFTFRAKDGSLCGIENGTIRWRTQLNPRSLPSLTLGPNKIQFTSQSQQGAVDVDYGITERHRLPLSVTWKNLRGSGLDAVFLAETSNQTVIPLSVTNKSDQSVSLRPSVTHSPKGWSLSFAQQSISLAAGQTQKLLLTCHPPENCQEHCVGAEIDLRPDGTRFPLQTARKRLLICAMHGSMTIQAERAESSNFVAINDPNAVGGVCLAPNDKQTDPGKTSYSFNVHHEGDYYLAARVFETAKYSREATHRFVIDGETTRSLVMKEQFRLKLDHYSRRWHWRMLRTPIHMKPGKHSIEVFGLNPNCRLDGFVLATNKELILKTLFNPLFCPAGFDDALIEAGEK